MPDDVAFYTDNGDSIVMRRQRARIAGIDIGCGLMKSAASAVSAVPAYAPKPLAVYTCAMHPR